MLYNGNTFRISSQCFLYLDRCLLPQRIDSITHLWIDWGADGSRHPKVEDWRETWKIISEMKGLRKLLIGIDIDERDAEWWNGWSDTKIGLVNDIKAVDDRLENVDVCIDHLSTYIPLTLPWRPSLKEKAGLI
jgi:hypothetical protein